MSCVIPFSELVPNANVRFAKIDGQYYMSIRDLIMVFCETDNNYAGQIWRRLPEDKKNEVQAFCMNWKFSGAREKNQDVITLKGALKLIMWLPGNTAKDFRSKATDILTRYLAGDCSLLKEIEANAASDHPVNNMARAAIMESEGDSCSSDGELFKKRKLQREEALSELEIKERTLALENGRLALENGRLAFFKNSMELLKDIRGGSVDERTSLQYEDLVKNITFTKAAKSITNGESGGGACASDGISLSIVAALLGYKNLTQGQLSSMGMTMAKRYREKYGKPPSQHNQYHNGMVIPVNSYTERDRDMMETVIKEHMMERPPMPPSTRAEYKKHKSAAT